eukprot:6027898-Pleurochrysis_carterae.AAC.8
MERVAFAGCQATTSIVGQASKLYVCGRARSEANCRVLSEEAGSSSSTQADTGSTQDPPVRERRSVRRVRPRWREVRIVHGTLQDRAALTTPSLPYR